MIAENAATALTLNRTTDTPPSATTDPFVRRRRARVAATSWRCSVSRRPMSS